MSSVEPAEPIDPTNVTVVVRIDGVALPIARVRAPRCDLSLVADLLRLRLHVRRLGWSVELTEVDDRLRDLLAFIGFAPDGGPAVDADDPGCQVVDDGSGRGDGEGRDP